MEILSYREQCMYWYGMQLDLVIVTKPSMTCVLYHKFGATAMVQYYYDTDILTCVLINIFMNRLVILTKMINSEELPQIPAQERIIGPAWCIKFCRHVCN